MASRSKLLTEKHKLTRSLLIGLVFLLLFGAVFAVAYQFREPTGNDTYRDMAELLKKEPTASYELTVQDRKSPVLIITPHGGRIEPFTSAIGSGIAGDTFSYFEFKGLLDLGAYRQLHVSSVNYNPPDLIPLNRAAELSLSIHGISGNEKVTYIGGRDEAGIQVVRAALEKAGFLVDTAPLNYTGTDPKNFVNRNSNGMGIQLELTLAQRRALFTKRDESRPNKLYEAYVGAIRSALTELELKTKSSQ